MLCIKTATPADVDTLVEVGRSSFYETFAAHNDEAAMQQYLAEKFTREQLAREFEESNARFLLAEYDGHIAGYAKLRTVKEPAELVGRRHLELERLYVRQVFHGRKIGQALMATAVELARQDGYEVLWLGVWGQNQKAMHFYESWGFAVFGEHVFRFGPEEQTDLLMKLELR